MALAAALCWTAVTQFARRLETAAQGHDYAEIANTPEGLVLIEKLVGAVPFLALTARYEAHAPSRPSGSSPRTARAQRRLSAMRPPI